MTTTEKKQESRIRGLANRRGYRVEKSRQRSLHIENQGMFMLIQADINQLVLGVHYDASLEEIEAYIRSREG